MKRRAKTILLLSFFSALGSIGPIPKAWGDEARSPESGGRPERPPTLVIRAIDYAEVPSETLAEAQREAQSVFRKAGFEIEWVDCAVYLPEDQRAAACERPRSANDFYLRILPGSNALLPTLRQDAGFGYLVLSSGQPSYLVTVIYCKVREAAA